MRDLFSLASVDTTHLPIGAPLFGDFAKKRRLGAFGQR